MKRLVHLVFGFFFLVQFLYPAADAIRKAPVKQRPIYIPRLEPAQQPQGTITHRSSPVVRPVNRLGLTISLVDSSKNGYGMIVAPTRPLEVHDGNFFFVYRQWAGDQGTSGQIGAAYSSDAQNWSVYTNLNPGMGIGRYPSALGNLDYPYAIWNEYTGQGAGYGGRPYYSYDEFGWDGNSMSAAYDIDVAWADSKDLWVGSPDHSYDAVNGQDYFNVVYADWTRSNSYAFHSEAYQDGYVVFGNEIEVIDVVNDMVGGDASGSYTSSPVLDINDDGIGYVAVTTYFLGGDQGTSPYSNRHTIAFKQTTDYGATWSGGQNGSNYYYLPDIVLNFMLASGDFPSTWYDACSDTTYTFEELFATYDFDMRVDSQGNPHFIVGILPAGGGFVYPGISPANGFYHFWIDKDYLANPGPMNTPTGWNYSFVASAQESWMWSTPSGGSYWQVTFPSLAISEEGDDVMYVVSSMVVPGPADDPTPSDTCNADETYPEWSEDVFVIRSTDGGVTWEVPYNATNTPDPDPNDDDSPEEISAHAAAQGATSTRVYLCYQMPDWLYGSTTGDPDGPDYKNRVYAGWVDLDLVRANDVQLLPDAYALKPAYPNPFNPSTNIVYQVAQEGPVKIQVFDLLGQQVTTLVDQVQAPNEYTVTWDGLDAQGRPVPSGVYLYRMDSNGYSQMRKMMLLK
ncbi:MAG: T9SS C-terminal target domain-containing protein [Candidatus Neomarinimicrobiota bacterium]|nr:MAG: T9SS C-terminal target domain-containing protein [Candidatus Neomarinimicrobiota bacterium]